MTCLAIIPARGGSKRIPEKNIKNFCGKPIIAYSIEAALKSEIFDEVMVSTDAENIKDMALSLGAVVPFLRSQKNADDYATTADVIVEVIKDYQLQKKNFDHIVILYPTAPFITAKKLKEAWETYLSSNAFSLLTTVKFSYPVLRSLKKENDYVQFNWPEYLNSRSQDLPEYYHDAGQFYMLKVDNFMKTKAIFTEQTLGYELLETEVQDIDTLIDWQLAELKFKLLQDEQTKAN